MTKFRISFKYPLLAIAGVALLLSGGAMLLFLGTVPDYSGKAELQGLSAKVDVYRDAYGVPHIFAANRADALRALGYLHASERMFQMEMNRRAGQGRLAEAVGPDLLGVDKFIRTLGLYGLAQNGYEAMSPDAQVLFQAYADGVNAWLTTHHHTLPPEFTLLGITPDPWRPADSVVWGKLMALQLSHNYRLEMLRGELAGKLSPEQMKMLFPVWGDAPVTTEPRVGKKAELECEDNKCGVNGGVPLPLAGSAISRGLGRVRGGLSQQAQLREVGTSPPSVQVANATSKSTLAADMPQPASGVEARARLPQHLASNGILDQLSTITSLDHAASNEWVISGSRTQSGKPILANDPHLSLEAPILWYLARIVTPDFNVKGATVPGLPAVLLGQNNNIAWGLTTTGSDVQDLFVETIDPKNPANYLTPSGSKPFDTHKELIPIKGREGIVVTIRATRHGPVLSDVDAEMATLAGTGKVMAFAFTGLGDKDRTAEALLRVNQALNWKEFVEAFRIYQAPPQNVVFADIKGDIGWINPGLVPVRKHGDGTVPADGASGENDWKGTIPFEEWPKLINPPAGFVFNSNNAIVSNASKNFYGVDWEEPYRAMRQQQFLDTAEPQTLDSSAAMQADHVSLVARQLLPYLLRLNFDGAGDKDNQRAAEALDMLRGWDGTMDKDRAEPLIFDAWLLKMHEELLVQGAGMPLTERGPYAANAIAAILSGKDNAWCKQDACARIASKALVDALTWLSARDGSEMKHWRWGKEHQALLQNKVFKHFPILGSFSDLTVKSSGDFYTLDRGGSFDAPADKPYARQHGGGYRAIYDLSNPDRSRFMITTGESGNIIAPHYGDLVQLWNNVKYISLSGTADDLQSRNAPLLEFTP